MKEIECYQHFSHYKSIGIFSDAQGQLTPKSLVESGHNSNSSEILWLSSITYKYKRDPIKNEGARVLTRSNIDFSDAQGKVTPQSLVESS